MTRVLLAGDHFILNGMMRDALAGEVREGRLDMAEVLLPWPVEPFGPVAEVREASGTEDAMIEALRGARICLTQMAPVTERVLAASPSLRLVCVGRGGPVNVNLRAAQARGVTVTYAPGRNATATAEHTVALILAAVRAVPARDREVRAGLWRSDHYSYDEVGPELRGATVGLVGFGAIGRGVARILGGGFGARVLVYDPYAPDEALTGLAERAPSLSDLLDRSLVVSLHARLTPETEGLLSRERVFAMRPGAVLVNAARGALLDYGAVVDALREGHLRAAAFDVFAAEPLPADSPLRGLDNVVMTPHLAGASQETAANAIEMMVAEVVRHLAGLPPRYRAMPP